MCLVTACRNDSLVAFVGAVIWYRGGRTSPFESEDVITSGSPAGVAAGMDQPRYLDAGDEVEARIGNLGTLTVKIAVE